MPDWISDLIKQGASSLVTAAIPIVMNGKFFQLPFVNPQVPADLWLASALLAFVGSFLSYGLARPGAPPQPASRVSISFAIVSFLLGVFGLIAIIFMTSRLISIEPGWESFMTRIAYVLFFVGLGPPLGWALGRTVG